MTLIQEKDQQVKISTDILYKLNQVAVAHLIFC